MSHFRTLLSHRFHALLKPRHPSQLLRSMTQLSPSLGTIICRTMFTSPKIDDFGEPESCNLDNFEEMRENERKIGKKKPLDVLFKEAVGLSRKLEESEGENEESESESGKLKARLRRLESVVRRLKENSKKKGVKEDGVSEKENKPKSLYSLFVNGRVCDLEPVKTEALKREHPMIFKELPAEMVWFVRHLYNGGYFNGANFLPNNRFDVSCFDNSYGREYVKSAAVQFGKDNQEIAKWLSGSDLKKVALFGCPNLDKKTVFSAKISRAFFRIQEDTVCSKCVLNQSCKYVNKNVWNHDTKNLSLPNVMRVITVYAMESVHPQLVVPDEVKTSVDRLLNEVVKLSQTTS